MAADGGPVRPTSGWTDEREGVHIFPVRVYYEDTDAAGIVYYVNYLKYAERARTEMLRILGREQQRMIEDDGVAFVVKRCELEYHAPARLDDALEVHTRLIDIGGASIRLNQQLKRGDVLLADMVFRLAVLDRNGRPARVPADVRQALAARGGPKKRSPA